MCSLAGTNQELIEENNFLKQRIRELEKASERKQAASTWKENEECFNAFMNHIPNIAWMKDKEGRYVYLNRTYVRRFGVKKEVWLGLQ